MKKILCSLLAATFVSAMVVSGCSFGTAPAPASSDGASSQASQSSQSSQESSESSKDDSSSSDADNASTSYRKVKATLLKSYTADDMNNIGGFDSCKNGFFFYTGSGRSDPDSKFGVINTDTYEVQNAEYTYMEEAKGSSSLDTHFYACTKATSHEKISEMNSFGIIDTTGKLVVPLKYASIEILNEKYAKVVTISDKTTNESDALVYQNPAGVIAVGKSDNATLYKGKWQIYDMEKNALVKDLQGTKAADIEAKGSIIKVDKNYYGSTGDQLDNVDKVFETGCYTVVAGGITHVNDSNGTKLFQFDNKSVYLTNAFDDDTFIESVDSKYYLVDKSGAKISADFENSFEKKGNYLFSYNSDTSLYDMFTIDGEKAYTGEIDSFNYYSDNEVFRLEDKDDNVTYLDKDAKLIGVYKKRDSKVSFDTTSGIGYLSGDSYRVYNYSDKDLTITSESSPKTIGIFTFSNDKGAVNTLDGSKLIPEDYNSTVTTGHGMAIFKKTDGSADLYKISFE